MHEGCTGGAVKGDTLCPLCPEGVPWDTLVTWWEEKVGALAHGYVAVIYF